MASTTWAEPSQECTRPGTERFAGTPWAQQWLRADRVHHLTKGSGVLVAVVDSGVDAAVPQLAGAVLRGRNTVARGPGDRDCLGRGTFAAGLIVARQAEGTGVLGLAPEANVLPVRQNTDARDGTSKSMADAIRYAVDSGARVVAVSASPVGPSSVLEHAVSYADRHGVLVVASAGMYETADGSEHQGYPAGYSAVLAVAGSDQTGVPVNSAGLGKIDLLAPGKELVGLGIRTPMHVRGDSYDEGSPAALVAGTAALVAAYRPGLDAAALSRRLRECADHAPGPVPNRKAGWGVVNPYATVTSVLSGEAGPGPGKAGERPKAVVRDRFTGRVPVMGVELPDHGPRNHALAFSGIAAILAAGLTAAALLVPRACRRSREQAEG
ncbi:S8 family serine peptidase [Streptomyces sp. NPDC054841]